MKALVIGLGSMGKRRIRILKEHTKIEQIFGVDLSLERRVECEKLFNIETYSSIKECCNNNNIDIAVISTSPLSHNNIICECLDFDLHIFTEINLVSDGYEKNIEKAHMKNKVLFLSSTFLYRKEMDYFKDAVNHTKGRVNYSYHVGQYLPDWHPWESYENYFVGETLTNGCRELFAIELPWITKVFGKISSVKVCTDKISQLKLNYNDNYIVVITHENGYKGVLLLDVVTRKAVRNLEIYGENLYLTWDGTPKGLIEYDITKKVEKKINLYQNEDSLEDYNKTIIENAYTDEINTFINVIEGKDQIRYTFEEDKELLEWIDMIENKQ